MKHLVIATLLLVSIILVPGAAFGHETYFLSAASGKQEVPSVISATDAWLELQFREDSSAVRYSLVVADGVDIFAAHLHCGVAGTNGGIVVGLYGAGAVDVDGELASGVLRNPDIIAQTAEDCGVPINNIASLLAAIRADLIYLNVHSAVNPGGEVRAQILGF